MIFFSKYIHKKATIALLINNQSVDLMKVNWWGYRPFKSIAQEGQEA